MPAASGRLDAAAAGVPAEGYFKRGRLELSLEVGQLPALTGRLPVHGVLEPGHHLLEMGGALLEPRQRDLGGRRVLDAL